MNTSDKYYLKEGKLELSMLDEEDEECALTQEHKQTFESLESEHITETKQSQPKLKIDKDISNTLHIMGQFLTKTEQEVQLSFASAKESLGGLSISKSVHGPFLTLEECLSIKPINLVERAVLSKKQMHEAPSLNQRNIDNLLETFFKPQEGNNG